MTARIESAYRGGFEGRPGWRIRVQYDAETVEAVKAAIPWQQRSYDDVNHEWWVAEDQADALERALPSFAAFRSQLELF